MARANVGLTGIAAEFIDKIPLKKRGVVISVLLAKIITSGIAREVLSSLFTKDEIDGFLPPSNSNTEAIAKAPLLDEPVIVTTVVDSNKESGFKVKL